MRKKYLRKLLEKLPAFQAVFRALEAEAIEADLLAEPILDVGCGQGIFTEVVIGRGKDITGIDIDERELFQARKKGLYRKLVAGDARFLPFGDQSFQTVISNSVLEHIKEIEPVLKEINRVLVKGGKLVLTAPSEKRIKFWPAYRFFSNLNRTDLALKIGKTENNLFKHYHCWSGKKWQKELTKAGFRKVDYQYRASLKTALLSDILLLFAPIPFLEKRLFGRYLGWRKFTAPIIFFLIGNIGGGIDRENGCVIVVKAEK